MTRPKTLILALSSGLLTTSVPVFAQSNTSQSGLHSLFVAAGKQYFGTATETNNFNDAPYLAILNDPKEFGQITPENSQKWEVTQPRQGQFVFTNSDLVAAKAKSNNQILRCHTLTWHSQLPPFGSSLSPFQSFPFSSPGSFLVRAGTNLLSSLLNILDPLNPPDPPPNPPDERHHPLPRRLFPLGCSERGPDRNRRIPPLSLLQRSRRIIHPLVLLNRRFRLRR